MKLNCEVCGEAFEVPKQRGALPKFCSDPCREIGKGRARQAYLAKQPEKATEIELVCQTCTKIFMHPAQRGRRPLNCPACRKAAAEEGQPIKRRSYTHVAEKLDSIEIVDRLELALRARGTHISQHRKDLW